MKRVALFAGSFDPITVGHVDLITRAAAMFDELIVLVADNPDKAYLFSPDERIALCRAATSDVAGVRVERGEGMTADAARRYGAVCLVRGLRNENDLAYEIPMATYHRAAPRSLETVFLVARPGFENVTSTEARRRIMQGTVPDGITPDSVRDLIMKKIMTDRRR